MFLKYNKINLNICIIGGGYIGLPLALAFVKKKIKVTLYDINKRRIDTLKKNIDYNYETSQKDIKYLKKVEFTNNIKDIEKSNVYIITTPTPVTKKNKPDLRYIKSASKSVGLHLKENDIVIYESTVYPGLTEEICLPLLEKYSKLYCSNNNLKKKNVFHLGYSPERINPGDKKHTLEKICKIVSSNNNQISKFLKKLYREIIIAKVVIAKDIKTAEAAKVIENTQRDINIAFINELSIIFNKLNIRTLDVLNVAKTKWNFLNFKPGLVGGHCIGVDPYYLTYCAKKLNVSSNVILSGRKINNSMPSFIANCFYDLLKLKKLKGKNILIFGATFKENCNDTRNSKSIDLAKILKKNNFSVDFIDPYVKNKKIDKFKNLKSMKNNYYSAIFFNVKHNIFLKLDIDKLRNKLKNNGIILDIQNIFPSSKTDFCL
jgi:UDP-N-acetyl-D-glucosamine/UDP-N-acetyl-D-galactosamine dehydrogenase